VIGYINRPLGREVAYLLDYSAEVLTHFQLLMEERIGGDGIDLNLLRLLMGFEECTLGCDQLVDDLLEMLFRGREWYVELLSYYLSLGVA
jgi:hypothetical protein